MSCGYKGKGILIHLIIDAEWMPLSTVSTTADADEREQVPPLIDRIEIRTGRAGRSAKKLRNSASDSEKEKGKAGGACYDDRAKISS